MRTTTPAITCALVAIALWAAPSTARAESRLVLDRVIAEPSYIDGRARLRAFVSPLTLEGRLLDTGAADVELRAGGSPLRAPHLVSRFSGSGIDLALAVVVETGFDYEQDLPAIQRALAALLRALPRSSRVAVVSYGGQIEGGHRLDSAHEAIRRVESLLPDLAPEDPRLIEAGERALRALRRAEPSDGRPEPRRIMVVVSDGRDVDPRPERYRQLGERAARRDVRIHSIAYSPVDNRRPLLGLGELSKRSGGTFRWVRDPRGLAAHADNLRAEILDQPVLTSFPPADEVAGKRLHAALGDVGSEPVRVRDLSCGGETCEGSAYCAAGRCVERAGGRGVGIVGWLIRIAVGGVLLLSALVALGFALTKRDEARKRRAAAAVSAASVGPGGSPIAPQPPGGQVAPQPPGAPVRAQPPGGPVQAQPPAGGAARPQAPGAAAAPAAATLFVVAGPRQGQRLPLRHGFTIGTHKRCDFVVPSDPNVAARHAQILADAAGGYTLVDMGSTGGTFVNGVRATQMRLAPGASIKIGGIELRFFG